MNLSQYIIVILAAQTVRCNVINGRFNETKRTENKETNIGVNINGNNREFSSKEGGLITYSDVSRSPSNDKMTSLDFLSMIMTAESPSSSIIRMKRRASGRSPRRKKCDPADANCKPRRKRTKKRNKGKVRKEKNDKKRCRKKGDKKKKGCKKRRKNRTPKPPPINSSNHSLPTLSSSSAVCVRSYRCPPGHCCARRHHSRVCIETQKLNDVCSKPIRKNRKRNADYYERCGCEPHLVCRPETEGGKLYKCLPKT